MKQTTFTVLMRTYIQLQQIVAQLYAAMEIAMEAEDFEDASLLQSRADKIYEEAENLEILLSEIGD